MHLEYDGVNDAFYGIVEAMHSGNIETTRKGSRAGEVIQVDEPVLVTYTKPTHRVLLNPARDANPFFHLYEALWMLAGRNDVAPLAYYSSNIGEIASDDGKTFNGAYGYRWRQANNRLGYWKGSPYAVIDQLDILIDHLQRKPESRRAVLQMWNVEDDLLKLDTTKDVCCNTAVYFALRPGTSSQLDSGRFATSEQAMARAKELGWENDNPLRRSENRYWYLYRDVPTQIVDMTVTNRSNDLIWGMLGANVVHFSILQEYVACALGGKVGDYHHFTNNLHAYVERWKPKLWLEEKPLSFYPTSGERIPLVRDRKTFDQEVATLVNCCYEVDGRCYDLKEPFLSQVAAPMFRAFWCYKNGAYASALESISRVASQDWRLAGREWIMRRLEKKGISVE